MSCRLFADDNSIKHVSEKLNEIENSFNHDLSDIDKW